MYLFIECVVICLLMWGVCFLCTGGDEKNLIGYRSYPTDVQNRLKKLSQYKDKIQEPNMKKVFLSNLLMFTVVLFVFGFIIKRQSFFDNFLNVFIVGEVLNVFDLVVIDLLWWRNTKRIRFSEIPEKEAYQNPQKHIDSFVRGCVMYVIIALIDGVLLTIFF